MQCQATTLTGRQCRNTALPESKTCKVHGDRSEQKLVEDWFDRGFVAAAVIIGLAYVLLILTIAAVAGKESAGVAGVALTALAAALFKTFERLRFERLPFRSQHVVEVPGFDLWFLAFLCFGFLGVKLIAGLVLGVVGLALDFEFIDPKMMDADTFYEMLASRGIWLFVLLNSLAHLVAGILGGRVTPPKRALSYVVFGAFLSILLEASVFLIPAMITGSFSEILEGQFYVGAVFWLPYIYAALIGARLTRRGY